MNGNGETYTFTKYSEFNYSEYYNWKSMVSSIFGMIENTGDIILEVIGELYVTGIFVRQYG